MLTRQSKVPIEVAYASFDDKVAHDMVLDAYTHPVYVNQHFNQDELDAFVREKFMACLTFGGVR